MKSLITVTVALALFTGGGLTYSEWRKPLVIGTELLGTPTAERAGVTVRCALAAVGLPYKIEVRGPGFPDSSFGAIFPAVPGSGLDGWGLATPAIVVSEVVRVSPAIPRPQVILAEVSNLWAPSQSYVLPGARRVKFQTPIDMVRGILAGEADYGFLDRQILAAALRTAGLHRDSIKVDLYQRQDRVMYVARWFATLHPSYMTRLDTAVRTCAEDL